MAFLQSVSESTGVASFFQSLTDKEASGNGSGRVPFEFTCSMWDELATASPPIVMSVNPTSVQFKQAKRTSSRKTIGGTVFFHWSDAKGRNLDLLTLTISGQTGAISGLGATSSIQTETTRFYTAGTGRGTSAADTRAIKNAQNWARLYNLTALPMIDVDTLKPNIFEIRYRSNLIPHFSFYGFFNEVLSFNDDAANPFSKFYTMSFTVTHTSPDIFELRNFIANIDASIINRSSGATEGGGTGNIA
jgi:hypothetical protein